MAEKDSTGIGFAMVRGVAEKMVRAMSRRVLLVEDDRVSRESLAYLLKGLGHEVRAVWSAEDAKTTLATFEPDVALLDVRLPGLPGDAFAVYLRHKFPHVKIVFVSGEFRLDDPERFGPEVEYIPKPLDFGRLLSAIE
jgi:CheY-like chemotaxis protein